MAKEKTCGYCIHFAYECIGGEGVCRKRYSQKILQSCVTCDKPACKKFVSEKECRHHTAVLLQHNRWRRDNSDVNARRMVNPTELGKAIDFAIVIINTYLQEK